MPALERRRRGFVPLAGIVASIVGYGLLVAGAWIQPDSSSFWKAAGTALIVAGVAVLLSILSLARLLPRYRPVLVAAELFAGLFAAMLLGVVWNEGASDAYGRALGVVGVLLAATTIAVPILHRASRSEAREFPRAHGVRFCPSCGRQLTTATTTETTCTACGAVFGVTFTSTTRSRVSPSERPRRFAPTSDAPRTGRRPKRTRPSRTK